MFVIFIKFIFYWLVFVKLWIEYLDKIIISYWINLIDVLSFDRKCVVGGFKILKVWFKMLFVYFVGMFIKFFYFVLIFIECCLKGCFVFNSVL